MTTMTFDTHAYIKELQSVGFTEEQAEVQAKTLSSAFKTNMDELATKKDLDRDLKELELRMVIKMGAMILAGVGLMRMWPIQVQYVPPSPTHVQEMRLPASTPLVPAK
ncbi:MAG: DUF1640 domain-containing protein [Magnetococcales bacterium]|nr:DUF1640 domain-containing protein [Magnetococcales bacterium]